MNYKDLTALLIKIGGLIIVVSMISFLPSYVSAGIGALETSWFAFFAVAILPLLFPLLAGILMLVFPGTIGNRIIPAEKLSELPTTYLPQLERLAMTLLGVYLLFRAISDLVLNLSKLFWVRHLMSIGELSAPSYLLPDTVGYLAATVVEGAIAIWLTIGSSGILVRKRGQVLH